MKKFRFTIVLSILILCWSLFASEVEDEYISNSSSYEIKFEPISATENVDLYTGVFTAKVNLMELLGQNDLSFPVTLTYNSDLNHKDKDNYLRQASQCGLGWKLELPVITASTLSYEKYSGTGLTQPISGWSITSSHIRPIYNQFIYSSPSGGGELVFHASSTSCDSFYIRDYKPWKIICDFDNYKWEIDSWKVIDEHGTTYTFNHKRKRIWRMYINDILGSCTSECSLLEYLYNTQDDMLINHYIIGYQWDLTEIKDVFGNEIEIQYLPDVEENVRDRYRDGVTCPEMPYDSLSHDYEYTRSSYINKIVSTGTGREIRFYWEDRSDDECRWDDAWTGSIPRSSCFTDWETNGDEYQEIFDSKRLAALKLVNTNSGNQVLKHVGFDYSESTFDLSLNVVRSLLTKIVQYDPSDTLQSLPALKFEYDMSDSANANVGALYRITYPDGGTKQIAFNQTNPSTIVSGYHYVDTFSNDKYRVASITTNDKMGNSSVKTYTWSSTQSDTCDYLYTYGHDHVIVSLPDNKGKIKYNHITNAATNKHGLISSILYYQSDSTNYDKKISKTWTVTHMETDTVPKVSGADYIRNSYLKTLTEETTILDGVSSTVAYSYNDFGMVSKKTATNTDGNKKITKIKYGWQDYSLLVSTNQLSDITGETVYLDTVLTSNLKSDFSMTMNLWNGYDMAPKNYRRWDGSAWVSQSDIITRNTDFGNILETEDGNDMRTTTRWDSSGLPIATVQNAEHEECSYLNFEGGDLLDGWSKTASASITSDMYFTGSAAFSAANGYWALANDWYDEGSNEDREYDSNKKYKVSVWVYLTNAADIGQTILGIGSHPTGYGADYGSATKAKQWELVTAECDASSILNDEVMRVWIAAKYCSGTVYFDDLRVYPSDAIMETTVYEPCTGTVLAKADPNNMPVIYDYDPYLRLVRTRNADAKLLSSTQHYYSRDVRENFLNTDPNYYRTITLTSANGYSNFAGSDGWTTSGSVSFGEYYNGQTTVKLTDSGSSASIYKATGTGDKIARVDFYTNNTGTPNVIGFDGSGYLFYIDYLTSTNQFRIRTQSSNTTFSDLTVADGLWYTAEIEKRANGTCLAWVYPKGESRNSANKLSATGYPGNWNPNVKSKMDDTGSIYLANHYVGDFAEEAVFTDGLGREFQKQVRDGDYDVITKNTFNKIGKTHQQYKPARISNASHNFFGLSSDSLKQTYTYTSDALKRIHQFFHYDNDDTVTTTFDSENLNGVNCNYTQKVDEKNLTQRIYTNKFGNEICQRHAIGTTDSTRLFKKYDILGNLIQVNTPNYYQPRSGTDSTDFKITMQYDMLGNLTQKTTPDDGITKFHYDKNKNLRFVQNDEQRNSYDFTVYHYDELSRVILIGEETDDYNWSTTAPSDTNTTFGTEASEWRIKKYYDENYVSGAENFCQGKLTKVEINQDSDNSAEYSFKYVYDQQGNLVEKRIIDDSGSSLSEKTIKYEYDHLRRKSAVSYPSGSVVNQDYNQVGQLEKLFTVE